MPASAPIAIVEASLTGAKAAESLRTEGFDGPITMIGEDPERPYERPPLSKEYLQSKSEREKVFVHRAGFYRERGIEFRTGTTVSSIDPVQHEVALEDGERLPYAQLLNQGLAAGKNLAGVTAPYDRVPYFYSDQYDLSMEYSGNATNWDRVVFRGNPDDGEFVAFWMKGRLVLAGMNANVWDVLDPIQHLIRERIEVDDATLADTDVPLGSLG
jgi:hypothetical protein